MVRALEKFGNHCPTVLEINNIFFNYPRSLDGSIQNIQVDSQLAYSQSPVILYLSPTSKSDESRHMPAIHFTSHKSSGPSATTDNAEIFKHLVIIYSDYEDHSTIIYSGL